MKKSLLTLVLFCLIQLSTAQFSTGTVTLTTGYSAKIDTSPTTVTLTLIGSGTTWLGIGFGGSNMATATDMFIWSDVINRDYFSTGNGTPTADLAANQSWTVSSDNVVSGTRTVVATRNLVSTGDYTFLNSNSSIPIIFAVGNGTSLAYHSFRSSTVLARTQLGVEDFSLSASSVFPNPSNGNFILKTKSALETVDVYTQTGAFLKSIFVNLTTNTEINISGLSTGIYLLQLKSASDSSWKKVVVE